MHFLLKNNFRFRYYLTGALLSLVLCTVGKTQAPKLKFKRIGIEQGLSNSTIENIAQDKRGFMWFGTRDGLNRFDGYQMTVYRYHPRDSTSISDNYIRHIHSDKEGNLWVGTINGLNRFVPDKNNFVRYKHNPSDRKSLSNNLVTSIYEDRSNNLWIGTFGGGLNLFKKKEGLFTRFRYNKLENTSLSDDRVNCIYEDKRGNLWVGTENGLNLFNAKTKAFAYQKLTTGVGGDLVVRNIQEDQYGNLWIGTADNGLYLFNPENKTFKKFNHIEKDKTSLASNLVRSLLFDKKGNLWVGGVNGGLDLFDLSSNSFIHFQNNPNDPYSLSQRTSSALFEDNQGNLWVGTHRGGINLYAPNTEKFSLYQQEQKENSLSYNDVKAFCEDAQGNIWVGTDGGGLNLFDIKKNSFRHYKYDPFNNRSIGSNEVLHVLEDSEGNLWAATWGGGLNLLNRSTGGFTRFLNDPSDKNSISSNYVQKIFEDSKKNLWIATYYGGLNLFNKKTKQFSRIVADKEQKTSLFGNNVVSINEDKNGNIWIGTDDGGLNCLNAATKSFTHYFNNEDKLPDLRIIFIDIKGRIWVGQVGLYLFDPQKNTFELYTDKAGLSTEFIKGITEDKTGNFWIATSNGLTKFNPQTHDFKKYNTADGLQGLEFEANAHLKTRSGKMFFGGINGFNSFYPEEININKFIPPVYITDFQIFNQKINAGEKESPLKNDISVTESIALSYRQSTFSFGFAALNFTASQNNQYAYRLENFDKDWNYVGTDRKASYTNLSPGKYIFRVKASNNDGLWNEAGTSVVIMIAPPFWGTWWFKIVAFATIAVALIFLYQFRKKQVLRKLEERKREEMHQVQLQFFTNISHEFRTPLSLILGPLEKLQKEDPRSVFNHYYKVIFRNAHRLMSLINELMDFRKVEVGALKLNVMPGNLDLFLEEISEEFSELAIEKKINFTVVVQQGFNEVWFDRQVLEKVITNLISNSFKYTKDGGTIKVEALPSLKNFKPSFENELILKNEYRAKKYVYLKVADNGIGISKESITHLFERYYKISDSHLGSGIGLAFVRSLTFLHKGNIYVYSERDEGTEIIIAIPVSREDYNNCERWVNNREKGPLLESIHNKYDESNFIREESNEESKEKLSEHTKPHILIVDDNTELRKFLRESLCSQYHITEAIDGADGIVKSLEEFPDLIISDVMMPAMDGIEFCKKIKDNIETSHIPFLMLTAKESNESKIEGMDSGADFYFSKPLSIDLLLLTIKNIFNQRQKLRLRYSKEYHAEAKEKVHSTKDKEFINELLGIIETQLANPEMDVEYICLQIGMSRTKLYQKIKNITGQSIGEFVRAVRLRKAVQIMTHEDVLLTDVMYRVGIQTQSYFTKAFKKEFGKTPSQYLQELKK